MNHQKRWQPKFRLNGKILEEWRYGHYEWIGQYSSAKLAQRGLDRAELRELRR